MGLKWRYWLRSEDTAKNHPVVINMVANDSDGGSPPLTVTGVSQPAHGQVTNNNNGTVTYMPNPNFTGTDTFTYTAKWLRRDSHRKRHRNRKCGR